jgi:hypothetical protein
LDLSPALLSAMIMFNLEWKTCPVLMIQLGWAGLGWVGGEFITDLTLLPIL